MKLQVLLADHQLALDRKEREIQTLLEENRDATLSRTTIEQLRAQLKNTQDDKSTIQQQLIEL